MPFKKSHDSAIPKITLRNFVDKSPKLKNLLEKCDKTTSFDKVFPGFKRNWTLSPSKNPRKHSKTCLKPSISRMEKPVNNDKAIEKYISNVLKEYDLEDLEKLERLNYKPQKFIRRNVFDKYFGENGTEEEEKLLNYINNCKLYEI